jgi:phospholipid/cholesterol/gamma-HCH transport system ATP-binding protein
MPATAVGAFTGLLDRHADLNGGLGGRIDITTTLLGTFSGKLVNGATTFPLSGQLHNMVGGLQPTGSATIKRTGLLPPLGGEVLLLGKPLYELETDERNFLLRRTGNAFQQDALFGSMSVGANVSLPLRELTKLPDPVMREMVKMKLALVGLPGIEDRMPTSLSGGQRKRVALARASILDPEVIFCDEPSAGLDPIVAASIDEALLQFRSALGITLVVVTHELESIRTIADRAIMFARGGVAAEGTIDELSESKDDVVFNFFHRVAGSPSAAEQAR